MKKLLSSFLVVSLISLNISSLKAQMPARTSIDPQLLNWVKLNVSPVTQLPYSFYIPPEEKSFVYQNMQKAGAVDGAIERLITQSGLDIYDGAVYQMVLAMAGGEENMRQAEIPLNAYWKGSLGDLFTIRSGYPINRFIYDAKNPEAVSSDNTRVGSRGFIFRILNADGNYLLTDPMNGKTNLAGFPEQDRLHWLDWKPVAGENAWVVMAAMQMYHQKYFDPARGIYIHNIDSIELRLSEEIARAAMILQSEVGGIRMAPLNTYRNLSSEEKRYFTEDNWWYNHISTENNISWYGAFRMLYEVTGKVEYKKAMTNIERYLNFAWDKERNMFYQGAYEINGKWSPSGENFALDVQTWAIGCLGATVIDAWLGQGTSYKMWKNAKAHSGVFDQSGKLIGVGYTDEHDRVSVEWSAGAMLALQEIGQHYMEANPDWAKEAFNDKITIRHHMETLHYQISKDQSAYSYSSKRGWIPFGWNSHDPQVMSLASTGWMIFIDAGVNPFRLIPNRK
jgi:hypothetical protein